MSNDVNSVDKGLWTLGHCHYCKLYSSVFPKLQKTMNTVCYFPYSSHQYGAAVYFLEWNEPWAAGIVASSSQFSDQSGNLQMTHVHLHQSPLTPWLSLSTVGRPHIEPKSPNKRRKAERRKGVWRDSEKSRVQYEHMQTCPPNLPRV